MSYKPQKTAIKAALRALAVGLVGLLSAWLVDTLISVGIDVNPENANLFIMSGVCAGWAAFVNWYKNRKK